MFKLYYLALFFLAVVDFFFLGLFFAWLTDAGKGQMLAGGAIVFMNGLVGAFIGLCLAILASYKAQRKFIFNANLALFFLLLIFCASIFYMAENAS